ncbi:VWA domain-containing protein [Candidatus Acetothermia bacterium]|nr:VWA domain-containing protein [Candidatus Acetothermia bacterium]
MQAQLQADSLDIFLEFIRLLRLAGLRVGLTETQDALKALSSVDDLHLTQSALKATLIKRKADQATFDRVFELFFGFAPEIRDLQLAKSSKEQAQASSGSFGHDLGEEGYHNDAPGSGRGSRGIELSYEQVLERAVQLIMRHAYVKDDKDNARRTQEAIALMSRMIQKRTETEKSLDEIRSELEKAFLKAIGSTQALEALLEEGNFENLDFARLDETEAELIEREIERLIEELAARPRRRYERHKQGHADIRRTIRKSIQYGGTPIKLARKKRRIIEPQIFILADISGSVEAFSRFFLMLTRAFHVTADTVRSFIFVDEVSEITERIEIEMSRNSRAGQAVEKVLSRLRLEGWGFRRSSYGMAFQQFYTQFGSDVDRHTTIIVLGDARNNNAPSRSQFLHRLQEQTERIIWLNPERQTLWDSGDSIMSVYALSCDRALECRNLQQLKEIVRELATSI